MVPLKKWGIGKREEQTFTQQKDIQFMICATSEKLK